jgi:hypothetical protein
MFTSDIAILLEINAYIAILMEINLQWYEINSTDFEINSHNELQWQLYIIRKLSRNYSLN